MSRELEVLEVCLFFFYFGNIFLMYIENLNKDILKICYKSTEFSFFEIYEIRLFDF